MFSMTKATPANTRSRRRGAVAKRVLRSKEFRDSYALSHATSDIAFQILANRRHRGLTQKGLGELAGEMKQGFVSRLENPEGSAPNIETLARIASAFDVALLVRFVPFSELVESADRLDHGSLVVPKAEDDAGLMEQVVGGHQQAVSNSIPDVVRIAAEDLFTFTVPISAEIPRAIDTQSTPQHRTLEA